MVANLDLDGCERPTVSLLDVALSAAADVRQKHAKANRQCVSGGRPVCIPFVTRCWALGCLCRGSRGGQGADCFCWSFGAAGSSRRAWFWFCRTPFVCYGFAWYSPDCPHYLDHLCALYFLGIWGLVTPSLFVVGSASGAGRGLRKTCKGVFKTA